MTGVMEPACCGGAGETGPTRPPRSHQSESHRPPRSRAESDGRERRGCPPPRCVSLCGRALGARSNTLRGGFSYNETRLVLCLPPSGWRPPTFKTTHGAAALVPAWQSRTGLMLSLSPYLSDTDLVSAGSRPNVLEGQLTSHSRCLPNARSAGTNPCRSASVAPRTLANATSASRSQANQPAVVAAVTAAPSLLPVVTACRYAVSAGKDTDVITAAQTLGRHGSCTRHSAEAQGSRTWGAAPLCAQF